MNKDFDLSKFIPPNKKILYLKVIICVFAVTMTIESLVPTVTCSFLKMFNSTSWFQFTEFLERDIFRAFLISSSIIALLHFVILPRETEHCSAEDRKLTVDLSSAIANNELELYYQPQVNLKTGKVMGMEALVRWHHPIFGFVNPNQFIHLAEKSGLIIEIGNWVIATACAQNKKWLDQGYSLCVSVNLSQLQLNDELVATVRKILAETNLPPQYLEFEITENVLAANIEEAIQIMRDLKALGTHLSLDDFGSGYSSLRYIYRFPIRKLKIDKMFLENVCVNEKETKIIDSIIRIGHDINCIVLAEGIENEFQNQCLRDLACDEGQGYLFGAPEPADVFIATLEKNSS